MSEKYGKTPPFDHTELIVKKGQELAKKLNADNFRFLDPTGLFISLYWAKENGRSLSEWVKLAREKVEEKYKLVTLDICKKEAEENYKVVKEFLNRVNV
jgi:hypothetical protein